MNSIIVEETRRLNGTFEILDLTFEKYGLELIGKGVKIELDEQELEVMYEFVIKDKPKIYEDVVNIIVNMYNEDNIILLHKSEYYDDESLDDVMSESFKFEKIDIHE